MHADVVESEPASSRRPSAAELAVLLLLVVIAGAIRFRGIGFLLPSMPLSDSYHIVQQVDSLRGKSWAADYQLELSAYPLLLGRITALLPETPDVAPGPSPSLAEHLRLASEPWRQIRLVATLLSLLIVPGTWLLARRFLAPATALLAAALVATSLMHVDFAVHEKPHGPFSGLIAFAVLAGLRLRRRGDVGSYLIAGTAIGLAVAMLHSGAGALIVLPVAILLRERRPGRASAWWTIAALAIVLVFVRVSYPAVFRPGTGQLQVTESDGQGVLEIPGSNQIFLHLLRGRGFLVVVEGLWSNDPVLFVGVLCGTLAAVFALVRRRTDPDAGRRKDLLVVLAFALPYLGAIGIFDNTQERYLLPLLPFFACFAAFGFERAFLTAFRSRSAGSRSSPLVPALSAAALPAIALIPAWRLGDVRMAEDTYVRAAQFLEQHARPELDRIVILTALDVPLLHTPEALAENAQFPARSNWVRYQMRLLPEHFVDKQYDIRLVPGTAPEIGAALRGEPIEYLRNHSAQWVVLPVAPYFDAARRALQRDADLAFHVMPDSQEPESGFAICTYMHGRNEEPWSRPFFLTVMSMRSMGQTLEIYRLR